MKKLCILLVVSLLSVYVMAQADTIVQPNVQIKVKKQFDNNGNVVGYDSTVVTTWHSGNFDVDADSLYKSMMEKMPFDFSVMSPDSMWINFNKNFFNISSPFDIEEEFKKMDEMFMKSMQMMMPPPPFENKNFDKKNNNSYNKKTSKTIKGNYTNIQPVKI